MITELSEYEFRYLIGKETKSEALSDLRLNRLSNMFHHSKNAMVLTDKVSVIKNIRLEFSNICGSVPEKLIGKNNRILSLSNTKTSVYTDMWE